jgi:hypothetical protein
MKQKSVAISGGATILLREINQGEVTLQKCYNGILADAPGTLKFTPEDWKDIRAAVDELVAEGNN